MGDLNSYFETVAPEFQGSPPTDTLINQAALSRKAKQKMEEFINAANAAIAAGVKIQAELDWLEHNSIGHGTTKRLTGTVKAFVALDL